MGINGGYFPAICRVCLYFETIVSCDTSTEMKVNAKDIYFSRPEATNSRCSSADLRSNQTYLVLTEHLRFIC